MNEQTSFKINRAPVLTLWAAVVAGRSGFDHDEALTLGRAVAGLNAHAKGKRLGIFKPTAESVRKKRNEAQEHGFEVELLHRAVPVVVTPDGIRATSKGKSINPASVEKYLSTKFGEHIEATEQAMAHLAKSYRPEELADIAFNFYVKFRATVAPGVEGWGAEGLLDLAATRNAGRP